MFNSIRGYNFLVAISSQILLLINTVTAVPQDDSADLFEASNYDVYNLEDGIEGIVPLKRLSKDERQNIDTTFKEGDTHEITVQEVDTTSKKIILMMDMNLGSGENDDSSDIKLQENSGTEPDKIELPKDIIDKIAENENSDEEPGNVDTETPEG